jgi:hypothetical protein
VKHLRKATSLFVLRVHQPVCECSDLVTLLLKRRLDFGAFTDIGK